MTRPTPGTLRERFDALWMPEPNTGCWLWIGRQPYGRYGYFSVRGNEMQGGVSVTRYKDRLAHRLAYELHRGPIPDGMYVCHTCDVPECVNPDHMFLGTQFENMRDCSKKGRDARTRATRCPMGHEYTPENTISRGKYRRQCRTCKEGRRARTLARYHNRKATLLAASGGSNG